MKKAPLLLPFILAWASSGGAFAASPATTSVDAAWNLLKEDQLERAIEPLAAALKKTPNHALLRYALGVCLAHTGSDFEAAKELRISARLDPAFPQTWYYLRTITRPDDPEGLDYFRKAAARNKKGNPHIHLNYGLLLLQRGKMEAALKEFQAAASLGAAYAEAHFEVGAVRYDQERFDEAVDSLRKALAIDPGYAEAKRLLAMALAASGKPAEEVEAFRKQALDLKPELSETEDALQILSDREKKRNWEKNLEQVGKLYLAPLKPVGLILAPLVPFLEHEPVGRTMGRISTSSGTARGPEPSGAAGRPARGLSRLAIKWTSSKHLEPLPVESLTDPDHFSFPLRLGGRKLLWAFFTTPNYRLAAYAHAPGKAVIELRKIPPVQIRFDPNGSLVRKGIFAVDGELEIDESWSARVEGVTSDTVRLSIKRNKN